MEWLLQARQLVSAECCDSARKVLENRIMEKLARSFNDMQAAAFNWVSLHRTSKSCQLLSESEVYFSMLKIHYENRRMNETTTLSSHNGISTPTTTANDVCSRLFVCSERKRHWKNCIFIQLSEKNERCGVKVDIKERNKFHNLVSNSI